jgi:preprotein translocase subunit SecF
MIWGVLIGTYSSIFLASPMLLYMRPPRPTEAAVPAEAAKTP